MKSFVVLLPLVSLASAWVVPDEQILAAFSAEPPSRLKSTVDRLKHVHDVFNGLKDAVTGVTVEAENPLDKALTKATRKHGCHSRVDVVAATVDDGSQFGFGFKEWINDEVLELEDEPEGPGKPPHRGPPHGPPRRPGRPGRPPHGRRPPHRGRRGRRPGHDHSHKPNQTIYQLISESKYTTKLAKLIAENGELVDLLNTTKANYTVFAPTDKAFEKIPDGAPEPPAEFIKNVLLYHVSPDLWPVGRLLFAHTAPTLLKLDSLGGNAQRRLTTFGFGGLKFNYFSRAVAPNIPATNGIIHGIDSILLPPPPAYGIVEHLPGTFSTLVLGLTKTGLDETLKESSGKGGTFFAPTNRAFLKLGPRINAFLFSKPGERFLKALLSYHVVPGKTLYSTAYYDGSSSSTELSPTRHPCHKNSKNAGTSVNTRSLKALNYHYDLPTLLGDRSIAVDITRRGPFIWIKVNAFVTVAVADGLASDGVIQVVNSVLIPPKQKHSSVEEPEFWQGDELSVEELRERLEPYVEADDSSRWKAEI